MAAVSNCLPNLTYVIRSSLEKISAFGAKFEILISSSIEATSRWMVGLLMQILSAFMSAHSSFSVVVNVS